MFRNIIFLLFSLSIVCVYLAGINTYDDSNDFKFRKIDVETQTKNSTTQLEYFDYIYKYSTHTIQYTDGADIYVFVGADGEDIVLHNNESSRDMVCSEIIDFIKADSTDLILYNEDSFTCGDYAEMVHNNAERKGINAAWVSIDFDNGDSHALNAFDTLDYGLIFIDSTGLDTYEGDICSNDAIANIENDKPITYTSISNCDDMYFEPSDGNVTKINVYW